MNRYSPLILILALYVLVGTLFATRIPAWQMPDEPAHYNYIRQLAQKGALPVIEPSDWDAKIAPLPPRADNRPVMNLSYEDHQPPLFYTVAAFAFLWSNGSLIVLRLLSLLLGAGAIVFGYYTLKSLSPDRAWLAAFGAAFIAFLPQRVFIMSGINNDSLSELWISLVLWLCVRLLLNINTSRQETALLVCAVGLSLWTKPQAYLTLPVAALALLLAHGFGNPRRLLGVPLIAATLATPLWLRNLTQYGGADFLGLQRHNMVVVGQLTTAQYIAQKGWATWLMDLSRITFQSFWGQFGWMTIPMPDRFYVVFLGFTVLSALLFLVWWVRNKATVGITHRQGKALTLLAAMALLSVLAFGWYNTQFFQAQGRYLYPALVPVAAALGLGWDYGLRRFERVREWVWLPFALALAGFNVYALFRIILPQMV